MEKIGGPHFALSLTEEHAAVRDARFLASQVVHHHVRGLQVTMDDALPVSRSRSVVAVGSERCNVQGCGPVATET